MPADIAVIGMACRFPDAPDPSAFWANILARRASFREVPEERWPQSRLTATMRKDRGIDCLPYGAFIDGVEQFAGPHFGMAPRRVDAMDPQQRLMLEVVREALQDAGFERRSFDRRRTATFVGASVSEYSAISTLAWRLRQLEVGQFGDQLEVDTSLRIAKRVKGIRSYSLPGVLVSMCATLVAQTFDLGGPAFTMDAACASSLASVVQACTYLRGLPPRRGDAPVAIAGGVYLQLIPDCIVGFTQVGALGNAQCRPFDANACGFLMGEGVGAVVLKRLEDAQADGDPVYAVVRGAAWNSDGKGDNPSQPSAAGQREVIEMGLEHAAIDPSTIGYIECHGTATALGDAIELQALSESFGEQARPRLGAVKANIGHALGAAGMAGFMRACLALHHGLLPPQTGFEQWHPDLARFTPFFEISTDATPWQGFRRAAVSSFGFGGANSFVLLDQAPLEGPSSFERARSVPRNATHAPSSNLASIKGPSRFVDPMSSVKPASSADLASCTEPVPSADPALFVVSAPTPALLADYLTSLSRTLPEVPVHDAADALSERRQPREFAAAFVATSGVEAAARARGMAGLLRTGPAVNSWTCNEHGAVGPTPRVAVADGASRAPAPCDGDALRARAAILMGVDARRPDTRHAAPLPFVPLERRGYWIVNDAFAVPAVSCERDFSLEPTQPTLADHVFNGRAIVPLAASLDMLAAAADLKPPFALADVRVDWPVAVRGPVVMRGRRANDVLTLSEIRPSGREKVTVTARVLRTMPVAPYRIETEDLPAEAPRIDLAAFYRDATFHGPSMQGIERVLAVTDDEIRCLVRVGGPGEALDVRFIDGAFQMALLAAHLRGRPLMLTHGMRELVILEPLGDAPVEVRADGEERPGGEIIGRYRFFARGRLIGWMDGVIGRATTPVPAP